MSFINGIVSAMGGPAGVGTAITGGINLFGGLASQLLTNRSNRQIAAANNDYQRLLWEQEVAKQEEMYNKYSSPAALKRQYEEAGINPTLAMMNGSGSVGQLQSVPNHVQPAVSYNVSPLSPDSTSSLINSLVGMARAQSEISNINADTEMKTKNLDVFDDRFNREMAESLARTSESSARRLSLSREAKMFNATFDTVVRQKKQIEELQNLSIGLQESELQLVKENLKWLPQEKQAALKLSAATATREIANSIMARASASLQRAITEGQYIRNESEANYVVKSFYEACNEQIRMMAGIIGNEQSALDFRKAKMMLPTELRAAYDEAARIHQDAKIGWRIADKVLSALSLVGSAGAAAGVLRAGVAARGVSAGAKAGAAISRPQSYNRPWFTTESPWNPTGN